MPALLALSLLALPHLHRLHLQDPFQPFRPGPPVAERSDVTGAKATLAGGWRLARTDDAFKGSVGCRLELEDVRYLQGVVTFSFGRRTDTANALFRVDGGPLRSVGEVGPEVAGLGASYLTRNTLNPSDGRVRLPYAALKGARRVDIRANDRRPHRSFALDGLAAALAEAHARGCPDQA